MTIFLSILSYIVMGVITAVVMRIALDDTEESSDCGYLMMGIIWPLVMVGGLFWWLHKNLNLLTANLAASIKAAIDHRRTRKQGRNCIIDLRDFRDTASINAEVDEIIKEQIQNPQKYFRKYVPSEGE